MKPDLSPGTAPVDVDLIEQLRRCQVALLAASQERDEQHLLARAARGRARRRLTRIDQLKERVAHVEARAERFEGQLDAIRSSRAWSLIEGYRSTAKRLRP